MGMKALWNQDSLEALQHRLQASTRLLLFIDYDSVLNPDSHNRPSPLSGNDREQLRELSEKSHLNLVIISNQSMATLKRNVGFSGIYLIANNGMEIFGPDLNVVHAETKRARKHLGPVVKQLQGKLAGLPGVLLEDREFSLAMNIAEARAAVQRRARLLMEEAWTPVMDTFTLRETADELEMVPRLGWGKHRAVTFVWNKFSSPRRRPLVIYCSGNEGDEEIFNGLGREGIGVVIGPNGRREHSNAAYFVKNRNEFKKILTWISQNIFRMQAHPLSS